MSSNTSGLSVSGFLLKHDFLVRRLHSLSGIVPVGAYMVVHLLTNSSILNSVGMFQANVNMIHNLGPVLPLVEWLFIFSPLIFHAVIGVWIATTGKSNMGQYRLAGNRRYVWQRWTGMVALVFIFVHVFHLHGWFHNEFWIKNVAEPLGMAQFRPYNAASTLAFALQGVLWPIFYAVGVIACVYHLANGIWTSGITWGLWISPASQRRATVACTVFGVLLGIVGLSALTGFKMVDIEEAKRIEDRMYKVKVESGEIKANPEKRSHEEPQRPAPPATEG